MQKGDYNVERTAYSYWDIDHLPNHYGISKQEVEDSISSLFPSVAKTTSFGISEQSEVFYPVKQDSLHKVLVVKIFAVRLFLQSVCSKIADCPNVDC